MKVIVAGPRDLTAGPDVITAALDASGFDVLEVVSGGATGIDKCAADWALRYNFGLRRFYPEWKTHGRAAGPIRNRKMAEYADALVVIKRAGKDTAGTSSMIREATKAGLPIYVHELAKAAA